MSKWVILHLYKGKYSASAGAEKKDVLSENQMKQMQTPYMAVSSLSIDPEEISPASLGLGWFLATYRGHYIVNHGGNIDGFSAIVQFIPYSNIGIVVLTNMNNTPLTGIISNYITDIMLDLDPLDINARLRARVDAVKKANTAKKEEDRKKDTKPSHKLTEFFGEYENPAYGIITITGDDKNLRGKYNSFDLQMEHWHYDVFNAKCRREMIMWN